MTPPALVRAIRRCAAEHDLVIACTIRCLPGPLGAPTILDHVDALSANMRQRARLERRAPLRIAALIEAWLLARHERRAARWIAGQTVVSPIDAGVLPHPPAPAVLPLLLPPATPSGRPDELPEPDIDVILTGNMRYPPNRDAAEWLIAEIGPLTRRRVPGLRVVIAGRGAAGLAGADGVEVLSDVPDVGALLRRSRIALAPLRGGTGSPIKVLEAVAAGAAVIATPWVAEALWLDLETAADAEGFACSIERLLSDETERRRRLEAARSGLDQFEPDAVAAELERLLAEAAEGGER
jgi:glycosyltransferase involved in cell wall biosynthesis